MSFWSALILILITLKLGGFITWGWGWVLLPVWISLFGALLVFIFFFLVAWAQNSGR